jgi:acetyltransferase-like isoleucine patch superfamily enzyme
VGMNAVILPGVVLGPATVVAAGAIVTKSFPDGFCIVAGVPARVIRRTKEVDPQTDRAAVGAASDGSP